MSNNVLYTRIDLRPSLIVALLTHACVLLALRAVCVREFFASDNHVGTPMRDAIVWMEIAVSPSSEVGRLFPTPPLELPAQLQSQTTMQPMVRKYHRVARTTPTQKNFTSTSAFNDGSVASPDGAESGGVAANAQGATSTALARIAAQLRRARYYPEAAQTQHWQGHPVVTFRIQRDGTLAELHIAMSSGIPALDAAALETVRRAAPLPYYPSAITLPIHYALR